MENYIREFLKMVDDCAPLENVEEHLKSLSIEQLIAIIRFSIANKSLSWKNRMLLQMVNDSPFSFWACDEQFIVKLWEAASTEIYGKDYYGQEFWRFIEKKERKKALEDCLSIISQQGGRVKDFDNYYAVEEGNIGIITQSFSLYDDINDKYLQGEIGLNIKLDDVLQEHERVINDRKLRLERFDRSCEDLHQELLQKKNEMLQKIGIQAEVLRRKALREECNNIYDYFSERIQQLLDEAMLDETDLSRLQNEFYDEFDKLELSISQSNIETESHLSFVEEKSRVEKDYQVLIRSMGELFAEKKKELSEQAALERKKKNMIAVKGLESKINKVLSVEIDYEEDMRQIEERLKSAEDLDRVLRIGREAEKRTEEAKEALGIS